MPPLIRWQWLWQSRRHLLAFGLGLMALGGLLLAYAILVVWPRLAVLAVALVGYGGYQLLQALLSPHEAFGGHDDPITPRKRRWQRPPGGRPMKADDGPIPLADD